MRCSPPRCTTTRGPRQGPRFRCMGWGPSSSPTSIRPTIQAPRGRPPSNPRQSAKERAPAALGAGAPLFPPLAECVVLEYHAFVLAYSPRFTPSLSLRLGGSMPLIRTISLLILAVSMWMPQIVPAQDTSAGSRPLPKSESHALRLSLLGTLAPIAAGAAIGLLGASHDTYVDPYTGTHYETSNNWGAKFGVAAISAGVFLGPTLGYLYVGRAGGLPIRLLAPVAGVAAALIPPAPRGWWGGRGPGGPPPGLCGGVAAAP